jgi:uncharacterized protein YndB with AHSA1/START domain
MKTTTIAILMILSVFQIQAQSYSRKYNEAENKIQWPEKFNPKVSDFYVHNEIEVNARPEQVWQLLIQAKNWINWYDGIQNIKFEDSAQQNLAKDSKVFWNSMGQRLNNTVTEFVPNERLAWTFKEDKIQGHHAWIIIPTETGCKVITDESQTGKLAKLQKIFLPRKLMKQHDKWLRLLKQEAEKSNPKVGAVLMNRERESMIQVLQQSHEKFMAAISGLTSEQLNYKQSPNKWSIAECIEHVTLAEIRFPEIVKEEMLKPSDPEKRKKIKMKDEDIQPKMTSRKWKAKSPEIFKPSNKFKTVDDAISAYSAQRLSTMDYVKTTQDDLRNHFWKHPLTGTIDLYQTLLLMSAHLERHTEQIELIKKAM